MQCVRWPLAGTAAGQVGAGVQCPWPLGSLPPAVRELRAAPSSGGPGWRRPLGRPQVSRQSSGPCQPDPGPCTVPAKLPGAAFPLPASLPARPPYSRSYWLAGGRLRQWESGRAELRGPSGGATRPPPGAIAANNGNLSSGCRMHWVHNMGILESHHTYTYLAACLGLICRHNLGGLYRRAVHSYCPLKIPRQLVNIPL